jgi:hypothetical protein
MQQQANNQEQEQEHDFGLAVAVPWEMTQQPAYGESVALLTQAFRVAGLQSQEKLQRLAFWLVRSRACLTIAANWLLWDYNHLKHARSSWARDNVLSDASCRLPHF